MPTPSSYLNCIKSRSFATSRQPRLSALRNGLGGANHCQAVLYFSFATTRSYPAVSFMSYSVIMSSNDAWHAGTGSSNSSGWSSMRSSAGCVCLASQFPPNREVSRRKCVLSLPIDSRMNDADNISLASERQDFVGAVQSIIEAETAEQCELRGSNSVYSGRMVIHGTCSTPLLDCQQDPFSSLLSHPSYIPLNARLGRLRLGALMIRNGSMFKEPWESFVNISEAFDGYESLVVLRIVSYML
ncbi:hypothetical protein F5Y13DRAFT_161229 [Hypoxylon sp. FL1857]|nr:hypothetical protein F5Y13DRAFT_161229 [Hypoxylon sp. FL1857]